MLREGWIILPHSYTFILLFITMEKKIIVPIIAWIILVAGLLIVTQQPKEIDPDLQRLDEISTMLSDIATQTHEVRLQIEELEMKEADLNQMSWALNDEATTIFMRLINPDELKKQMDEATEFAIHYWESDWQPGQLTEDGSHQEMPELTGETSHDRFKQMAYLYGLDPSTIWSVEEHYWIKEWVILCITIAETSWGNRWYGKQNIWSVGSNDRWDRPTYALMEAGLEAIWKTLNNQYLWGHTTLWCLSNAGSCRELNDNWKRYATSTQSREANMTACLSDIYEPINPEIFNIRR